MNNIHQYDIVNLRLCDSNFLQVLLQKAVNQALFARYFVKDFFRISETNRHVLFKCKNNKHVMQFRTSISLFTVLDAITVEYFIFNY